MSIFKESFRDYVKKQFNIRQKVISSGNTDKSSPSRLYHGFDDLVPGAFYGYQQKQCIIRMASLVDLMQDVNLDLGVTQPDGTRYGTPFNSYKGSTFARNYVLEGGVLSNYARNIAETEDGLEVKVRSVDVRGGFPKPGKRVNLSYGDPSVAADPTADGYGVVPMPGIIDANIRTKSAYGSLREAKVNFTCHNLRQLEILELLYMRPGYPVLLEWGWSPHISNNGEIINDFPSIADYEEFWNDKLVDQTFIEREVIRLKRQFNGNYDGFVGFITNFDYNSRPDGGFNCSTELISMGEVLDSLKVPTISFGNIGNKIAVGETFEELELSEKKQVIYSNTLGTLIQDLNNYLAVYDADQSLNLAQGQATNAIRERYADEIEAYVETQPWYEFARTSENEFAAVKLPQIINSYNKIRAILEKEIGVDAANQAMFGGEDGVVEFEAKTGSDSLRIRQEYIRWDCLSLLINKLVIPLNEKGQSPLTISTDRFSEDNNGNLNIEPLLYANYIDQDSQIYDVSCDPKICILPHQFEELNNGQNTNYTFGQKCGLFWDGLVKEDWGPIKVAFGAENSPEIIEDYVGTATSGVTSLSISPELAKRRIGSIYIEVRYIKKVFEDVFLNNKEASLGEFLNKLWKGITEACPLHNFGIRTDFEFNNIIQVIDLPLNSTDISDLDYDNLFKFNVLSNDTIVREFKYSTQIPSALKSTIAIQAQSGTSADSIDSVTFAAFNKAIKSRLHSYSEKFTERETNFYNNIQTTRTDKRIRLRDLRQIIKEYNEQFFDYLDIDREGANLEAKFGNIKTIIKEAQTIENYLEKSSSGYLKNQSIIPININMVLDGISGIVIGNVFRVDESRLPKAYREGNVAFIALGEEQNITAGQDWVTNIRGQMILFPLEEEITNLHRNRLNTNITVGEVIAQEVEEARAGFSVAESTNVNIDTTQVDQALEDQQLEEELTDLEKLGYTLDIQSNLNLNDTFWNASDVNYPGGGNKTYVLQNQIRYENYNSFTVAVARNAGVKVEDYKGFEISRLPNGTFQHRPDILLNGEIDSSEGDEYTSLLFLKEVIDTSDNKTE